MVQGLPVGFMTHALPVILRAQGVSLAHIGGFGLLMLPWSIKIFGLPMLIVMPYLIHPFSAGKEMGVLILGIIEAGLFLHSFAVF